MAFISTLYIAGSKIEDAYQFEVTKSIGENNSVSSFSASIDNYNGINGSKFSVGQSVVVKADEDDFTNFNREFQTIISATNNSQAVFDNNYAAQSFTVGTNGSNSDFTIGSVHITAFRTGTLNFIHMDLRYVDSTGQPSSTIIATGSRNCSTLTTSSAGEVIAFNLDGNLKHDKTYAIVLKNITTAGTITWLGNNNGSYAGGSAFSSTNSGGTWSDASGGVDDFYFDVKAGSPLPSSTRFNGILEDISYKSKNQNDIIELSGRDYSARLVDRNIEPERYNSLSAGSIIRDVIVKYTDDITSVNVQDSPGSIARISFNHISVFDGIKQLSDLTPGFVFYVDENKDLHFEPKSTFATGYTFDSGNVIQSTFKDRRDSVFNEIWVYGDRYLDGFRETFTAGSPLGGSVFTLLYSPHATEVTVSGGTIQPGGLFDLNVTPSGVKYLVDFDDKKIIFTSGTSLGANIPQSGNAVVVNYKRNLPIVKVGANEESVNAYGKRVKTIIDKNIKDPLTAQQIVATELDENSDPKKEGTLQLNQILNVNPSETVIINLPFENINNKVYDIIEANYSFNKSNNLEENVLSVKVNKKLNDVTDTMKNIILDIKKLQAQDIDDTDILTRSKFSLGSLVVRHSGTVGYMRNIGSSFILGHGDINFSTGSPNDWWKFNIGTDITVGSNSIGSNHMVLHSGATFYPGIVGSALLLTGSPSHASSVFFIGSVIQAQSNRSISLWHNGSGRAIWGAGSDVGLQGFSLEVAANGDYILDEGGVSSFDTDVPIVNNEWSHIVLTLDGPSDVLNFYVNGVLRASTVDILNTGSGVFYLGTNVDRDAYWSGLIDDVRIYSGALTITDVKNLYNNRRPKDVLVNFWSGNGILGSATGSFSANPPHFLGDFRGGSTIIFSGGYF